MLGVSAGEHIRLLDGEIEAEQLTDPLVLRDHQQALVQKELQAVVVNTDQKMAPPQVRTLVAHSLHQADELPFIRRKLEMARSEWSAEKCEGTDALVRDSAEPCA